jgi:YesN/AraC family two-component response regulator
MTFNKILISDKSEQTFEKVSGYLKDTKYLLKHVKESRDVMKVLEEKIYDLIMIDVDHPEENGIEAIQTLKNHPVFYDTPVIVITDRSNENILEYCYKFGADDIIAKPIDQYILHLRIKAIFEKLTYLSQIEMQRNIIKMKKKASREKYSSSSLRNKEQKKIAQKIIDVFEEKKLYLNKDFSIDFLAKETDINKVYLSQVISKELHTNFYDLVNKYRVKEAVGILISKDTKKYTFEAISELVGYNSRITFNRAFKKIMGVTPSDFIKSINISV